LFKTGQPLGIASSKMVVETACAGRHPRQVEIAILHPAGSVGRDDIHRENKAAAVQVRIVVCLFLLATQVSISIAQEIPVAAPLTTAQVVEKMVARNEQRAQALESYRATRVYHLEYHGLADKSADLVAAITYQRPDKLKFSIVSESGSALLNKRVLKRLMEAEVESMREENRRRTAMRPEKYEFRLEAYERTLDHDSVGGNPRADPWPIRADRTSFHDGRDREDVSYPSPNSGA
jgi:hypothetical protein